MSMLQETGWPIAAHNRYWSKDNVYAEQNGGQFKFYIGKLSQLNFKTSDNLNKTSMGSIK